MLLVSCSSCFKITHLYIICYGLVDTRRLIELGLTKFREPVSFQYGDLKHATENFNRKNILGQGGFGVFYKVRTPVAFDI